MIASLAVLQAMPTGAPNETPRPLVRRRSNALTMVREGGKRTLQMECNVALDESVKELFNSTFFV